MRPLTALVVATLGLAAHTAFAGVSVTLSDPNTAVAEVALSDGSNSYEATVTIAFEHATNLSASSLGLSAELFDPLHPPASLPAGVMVDPAFPVLIGVWPPAWNADGSGDLIFINGDEANQTASRAGSLEFQNTYQFEIHSADMDCVSTVSALRLYKAPHGSSSFTDVTDDLFSGSVRARGRGGSFSQFLVVEDTQQLAPMASAKLDNLKALYSATEGSNPNLGLTMPYLLSLVGQDIAVVNYAAGLADLDAFIADVRFNAGTNIVNTTATSNDAGNLLGLACTLRFNLKVLDGTPTCQQLPLPPPLPNCTTN